MSIEALVAKQLEKRFFTADDIAAAIRNALTEQAETHAIELRAYEATVANLTRERDEARAALHGAANTLLATSKPQPKEVA